MIYHELGFVKETETGAGTKTAIEIETETEHGVGYSLKGGQRG